jgi:hypothetical protein
MDIDGHYTCCFFVIHRTTANYPLIYLWDLLIILLSIIYIIIYDIWLLISIILYHMIYYIYGKAMILIIIYGFFRSLKMRIWGYALPTPKSWFLHNVVIFTLQPVLVWIVVSEVNDNGCSQKGWFLHRGVSLNMVGGHGGAKTFFLVEDDGIYK